MAKKLQRVFRNCQLTPDEAAADQQVRKQVAEEFPPSAQPARSHSSTFSELLKRSIRESGRSIDEIASEAGVSSTLLGSFLSGERDIHMTTADKLASSLRLEVTAE
jgi:hypothetical protein